MPCTHFVVSTHLGHYGGTCHFLFGLIFGQVFFDWNGKKGDRSKHYFLCLERSPFVIHSDTLDFKSITIWPQTSQKRPKHNYQETVFQLIPYQYSRIHCIYIISTKCSTLTSDRNPRSLKNSNLRFKRYYSYKMGSTYSENSIEKRRNILQIFSIFEPVTRCQNLNLSGCGANSAMYGNSSNV